MCVVCLPWTQVLWAYITHDKMSQGHSPRLIFPQVIYPITPKRMVDIWPILCVMVNCQTIIMSCYKWLLNELEAVQLLQLCKPGCHVCISPAVHQKFSIVTPTHHDIRINNFQDKGSSGHPVRAHIIHEFHGPLTKCINPVCQQKAKPCESR